MLFAVTGPSRFIEPLSSWSPACDGRGVEELLRHLDPLAGRALVHRAVSDQLGVEAHDRAARLDRVGPAADRRR